MQNQNIETKAKIHDLESLKNILSNNNATFIKISDQVDYYFNCTTGRLKLRISDNKRGALIYYEREDILDSKTSTYKTLNVEDYNNLKDMLTKSLGIKVVVTKKRKKYKFENTFIHIDEVKDLGLFVELESEVSEEDTYDKIQEEHKVVQRLLKINPNDFISESYSDLLVKNGIGEILKS